MYASDMQRMSTLDPPTQDDDISPKPPVRPRTRTQSSDVPLYVLKVGNAVAAVAQAD